MRALVERGDLERRPRAGRRLLEDQRDLLALEALGLGAGVLGDLQRLGRAASRNRSSCGSKSISLRKLRLRRFSIRRVLLASVWHAGRNVTRRGEQRATMPSLQAPFPYRAAVSTGGGAGSGAGDRTKGARGPPGRVHRRRRDGRRRDLLAARRGRRGGRRGGVGLVPDRRCGRRCCRATRSPSSALATRRRAGCSSTSSRGFGDGHVTGVIAWLILAANAIITGMVAVSFGSYASAAVADGSDGLGSRCSPC